MFRRLLKEISQESIERIFSSYLNYDEDTDGVKIKEDDEYYTMEMDLGNRVFIVEMPKTKDNSPTVLRDLMEAFIRKADSLQFPMSIYERKEDKLVNEGMIYPEYDEVAERIHRIEDEVEKTISSDDRRSTLFSLLVILGIMGTLIGSAAIIRRVAGE